MAEWIVIVLVVTTAVLALALLGFMAWREVEHKKQIDELTSKIMAKDYREYAIMQPKDKIDKVVAPTRKISDQYLGQHY